MSGLAPEPATFTAPLEHGGRPVPEAWNRTDAAFPVEDCIHHLVESQVARTPHAVAVVSGGASCTYHELNERANRLADRLLGLRVGPEVRVGVCLERGVELVVALLAVLKAGGAYVPLDPAYPLERLELMLADAGVAVLVTQERLRGLLPAPGGAHVVSVDGAEAEIREWSAKNPRAGAAPRNLAYLIYTSGSTGRPKGVAIEHQSAVAMLAWAWSVYSDEELGGMLASTSVCFDMSVFELFAPLTRGGRVIVVENALALPRSGAADQVRLVDTVPSAIATLLETGGIPAGVRTVNLGGELLKPGLVDALYAHGVERVYDLYGPSEDTTFSTYALRRPGAAPTIGRPIANTRCHVVDADLRPVGVGETGELYVAGRGITRGYLGRPGLTAGRYLPDPFSDQPGARMYRTGDRVRWLDDGTLEYLGRLDHQVKIRGYRVEPGEIEAVLREHPGVHDVVVTPWQPASGDRRLAAYLVPRVVGETAADGPEGDGRHGAAELVRDLRRAARDRLPEYMVPAVFVPMERFPLSPNGKVDRRALPAPPERPDELDTPFAAPRTETEARAAAIWAEVLGVGAVGVDDDVFTLGAHSLAVTQVASRLRARLGVELPLRELFAARTVAALAEAVERRRAEAAANPGSAAAVITRAPRDARLPLSTSQERVWFLIQLAPDNLSYNFQAALTFRGRLDREALGASLAEVVRRHEVFRTTFPAENGRPHQQVHPPFQVPLPLIDLSGMDPEARAREERRILRREFARHFDLRRLPLVRWILVRRGADEHVLAHVEHHIVHDGWSFNVFLRELLALYGAFSRGQPSPLPELPLQFGDFACAQREWLRGDEARRQLDFWRGRLAGSTPVLEMPFDRPRPAEQRFRGAAPRYELPAGLYERLRAASRANGVTLFATMMAAFGVMLSRWSGQTDLNVGTGIANRRQGEIQGLMGMFVNSMVLRTRLDDDPSFACLARRVHAEVVAAADHQELPFETLVEALRPDRSLSHNPLFQAMFSFHDSPIPELRLPGLEVEVAPGLSNGSAKFDMNVIAIPRAEQRIGQGRAGDEDGITLVWEYSSDLFDASTIDAMVEQYRALLEAAVAGPGTPVSRLPLTAPEARGALLAAGRGTREFPVAETIHARFERRVRETPDAPAVSFEGESLTYAGLNARANRLAHRLIALGVGPETRVGLCLERSAELVAAILAILKAGGGYVPLDPAYPTDRIARVLEDAGAPVLVTTRALGEGLDGFRGAALRVDADAEAIAAESAENPAAPAGPGSLAYVIYTSGSTGRPKGVQVTHANVVRLFDATDAWFGFGADDVWTLFHSCAFDFSVWETWGALLYGGRLVVVPYLTTRSPEHFHRLLADEGVTVLSQTPSAFRPLVQADLASGLPADALRLRHVVFGGEALDPQALRPWLDRHGDARPRLVNMYGITETTVHVTRREITRADLDRAGSPIGVPIPDLSLHLLDRNLEPVPAGVPGELFVGGAGVARGYLGRPELTAERFIRDPFSSDPEARLYRSGDLARRRADGELEYLGRADQQVKVRGFRIETGEVEAAVASHPSLAGAAVVVREDRPGEKRLVAYVVPPAGGEAPAAGELRAHVAATLPDYMVPAAFVALDALPLTENGKLDRRALPAPETAAEALATETYAAPSTADEAVLAEVWAEVLGMERVGIDDNYFALGGDSIRSVRVVAAARARGLAIGIPQLFRNQTIRALAAVAERTAADAASGPSTAPFDLVGEETRRALPDDVEDAYPVSQVQLAMLYHTDRDPGSRIYLNLNGYRVQGPWDEAALREALRRAAARHPLLRTAFDLSAAPEPIQRVHRETRVPLEVEDLRGMDARAQDAAFDRLAGRGFDWSVAPLLRVHVQRLTDDAFRIVLAEHHAVLDGWSVAALMTELLRAYAAVREGAGDPSGPPPAAVFRDFVALERQAVASAGSRAFWRGVVEGAPRSALPPREGGGALAADALPWHWVDLPAGTAAALRRVAEGAGVPLKTVLLAAHLRVLARLAGTDEVVSGYVTSGRPETRDGERVLGVFLNTVPVRVDTAAGGWAELLRRAWAAEEAVVPHRRFPLAEIVRAAGRHPLFEAAFNFNHFHVYGALAGGGVRMEGDRFFQRTEMPLVASASLHPASGELRLRLEYDPARLAPAQVAAFGALYARAVADAAAGRWEDGTAAPEPAVIHRRVRAQVERTPDAVALLADGQAVSYRALDERANRLAHHLVRLGVGPEARVGVCLERGVELIAGQLAVLKAGGAYVPMDPSYPPARLAFMLADSGAAVLVTRDGLRGMLEAPAGVRVVSVDGDAAVIAAERADTPSDRASARNLAYVIYTSGSTGRPKGAGVEHASLAGFCDWHLAAHGVTAADRGAQVASAGFDAAAWDVWPYLIRGAAVDVVPEEARGHPESLRDWLVRRGITLTFAPPALAEPMLALPWPGETALRWLMAAGDRLRVRPGAAIPFRVSNNYGPTECTILSTSGPVAPDGEGPPDIGRPVAAATALVLDDDGRRLPAGAEGELFVGGGVVGRGYLGHPALTASRFVPDPFSAEPGARMYRTGDRVRPRADGAIDFIGRADHQVKVRGMRVEPGEIEAVLRRHPEVADCVVVAREDGAGETRLVAYVAGGAGADALRALLRASLPEHMVPSAFVALDALPLSPNGKVDRRALPAPPARAAAPAADAPRNALEERVAEAWREVLRIPAVGTHDNFFDVGGTSLDLPCVHDRLAERHPGVRMADLFRHPTVAGLAAFLAGTHGNGASAAAVNGASPTSSIPAQAVAVEADVVPAASASAPAAWAADAGVAADAVAGKASPPQGVEAHVAEVWRAVLGRTAAHAGDHFFDLGGTSLLMYRVFIRLRELNPALRVSDLFRAPTVEGHAALLRPAPSAAVDEDAPAARSLDRPAEPVRSAPPPAEIPAPSASIDSADSARSAPAAATESTAPAPPLVPRKQDSDSDAVRALIARQLDILQSHAALMQAQLELLRGDPRADAPPADDPGSPAVRRAPRPPTPSPVPDTRAASPSGRAGGVDGGAPPPSGVREAAAPRAAAPGPVPSDVAAGGGAVRVLPASFAQEQLWLIDQMQPGFPVYSIRSGFRLRGALDVAALERALGEVVRRHDALRTTMDVVDGGPVQVVRPFAGFHLPVVDLPGEAPEREARVRECVRMRAERPLDLAAGPVFRAELLRLGGDEHVLLLCVHHAVADGWSLGVLLAELAELYAAARDAREAALAPVAMQFADFARLQRQQANAPSMRRSLAYWRARLAGAPELLRLPADFPRPAEPSYRGAHESIDLPAEVLDALRALARAEHASPFMVLLAAFQALVSRLSGRGDVVVGTPAAGRAHRGSRDAVGMFANLLALRTDLGGDPTFRVLLGRARACVLEAMDHQEAPFDRVVEALRPARSPGHSPLVQVVFTGEEPGRQVPALPGLRVERMEMGYPAAKFDLVMIVETEAVFRATVVYRTDLFRPATARRLLAAYRRVLEQVAADPDIRLSALALEADPEAADRAADAVHLPESTAADVVHLPGSTAADVIHPAESTAADVIPLPESTAADLIHLPESTAADAVHLPGSTAADGIPPAETIGAPSPADVVHVPRSVARSPAADGIHPAETIGAPSSADVVHVPRSIARSPAADGIPPAETIGAPPSADVVHVPRSMARPPAVDGIRPPSPPEPAPAGKDGGPMPLSFAQERLWFLDRMEPGSAFYNIPAARRLEGALDVAALERALGEIVRRHDSLRTTFHAVDGSPVQVAAPFAGFPLAVEDLSALAPEAREAEARRRVDEDAARPFELEAGPPFRAGLLRLADDDHLLLLCLHHVVGDGWSMDVLFRELAALYAAFSAGAASPLPALPVRYAEHAAGQREELRGEALERPLAYWRARLAGAPALLELPTDRPRPALQTYRGAHERMDLSPALLDALRAAGRREGATPYLVLLAAFQVLLSRYARSEDVVVGSTVAGRTRAGVEEVIGLFVNTLALRTDLSGDPTFRALLRRVRETALGAWEHQELPFDRLVAELRPERSLSHAPLCQVAFSMVDAPPAPPALPGVRMTPVDAARTTAKFDLTLGVLAGGGAFRVGMSYPTELFDRATTARMLRQLARLLEQVAADPDRRLSELDLLTDHERRAVRAWSAGEPAPPSAACVHDLFAAQAARTPENVAVVHHGARLSYRELDARSARLARHLRALGVRPETRVAVCLERTPELAVALLGILRAGGAYLPLDPAYPQERLGWMMEDAEARLAVTSTALAARLPESAEPVRIDALGGVLDAGPSTPPESGTDPENLSHLIFTSGSTGRPKGVMIRHSATVARLRWLRGVYSAEERAAVAASTSISFDVSVAEIFGTLCWGGTLVLLENALELPSVALPVTMAGMVPTAAAELLRAGGIPSSVRTLNLAGEPLTPALAAAAHATGTLRRLLNLYGPTEDTTYSTWSPVEPGEDRVRIGRPLAGSRAYVLDGALRPLPPGVPGELYMAGAGVARGYVGRPALTAESFLPDPHGPPGARMYRVRDLARWTDGGELECLGRTDFQVKVRGYRIEPGEIEAALRAHAEVDDAVVVARDDAPGGRRLVAYVTGRAEPAALRAHLRRRVPEYMMPSAWVALDALPRTPNGKLDRRALPAPAAPAAGGRRLEPETELEARLVGVWKELLGVEALGVEENFFDLGGHSLLLVRLQSRLAGGIGREMTVVELFQYPTVRSLAAALQGRGDEAADAGAGEARGAARQAGLARLGGRRRASAGSDAPPGSVEAEPASNGSSASASNGTYASNGTAASSAAETRAPGAGIQPSAPAAHRPPGPVAPGGTAESPEGFRSYPASFAQERLWFLDRLQPGSPAYNTVAAQRIEGDLDGGALERALGEVVRRHEVLRTTLREVDGAPVQVVAPFSAFHLPVRELGAFAPAERAAEVDRCIRGEARRAPDLREPLFRPCLLRLDAREHVLVLAMHHLIGDGPGLGVLMREMAALYAAFRDGRPSPLPPLPAQYGDFVLWQREQLSGGALERQLAYWRERLAGAPSTLDLPTDHPRPRVQEYRGASERARLPSALTDRLRALAAAESATPFMVVLAALGILLSRYAGTEDVVVGTPITGRTRPEFQEVIGYFANMLPLRTDLRGDPTFRELLGRVRTGTLGAFAHAEVPFERLVQELGAGRTLDRMPLFQVIIVTPRPESLDADLPGVTVRGMQLSSTVSKCDLMVAAAVGTGEVWLTYDTDLFRRETVRGMLDDLLRVLEQAVADPRVRLSTLELSGPARAAGGAWAGEAAAGGAGVPGTFARRGA